MQEFAIFGKSTGRLRLPGKRTQQGGRRLSGLILPLRQRGVKIKIVGKWESTHQLEKHRHSAHHLGSAR